MANIQSVCTSFKQDLLNGLHAFGTTVIRAGTGADSFKAALYTTTGGGIGAATTAYAATINTTPEVSGTNYTAGGVAVTFGTPPTTNTTTAYVTPSANIVYTNVTLTTAFDSVLLYNFTATGKNAVSVHTFTAQTITAGTLTLTMPANTLSTALIRIS